MCRDRASLIYEDRSQDRQTRLSLADQMAEVLAEAKHNAPGKDWAVSLCRVAQWRELI